MKKILFVIVFLVIIGAIFYGYWYLNQRKNIPQASEEQTATCTNDESITYCSGNKVCYAYCNNCKCHSLQCVVDSGCQSLFERKYAVELRNQFQTCGTKAVLSYCTGTKLCSVTCDSCGCQSISCYSDSNCANKIP
jgi:hypothetical protein